jgi:hypothetical protein
MYNSRADHVVHFFKDQIYVFGGMSYRNDQEGGKPFVKSLNTCEYFNTKTQKWVMLENFNTHRQAFSVCQFNDKFIFIIGGKQLNLEARIGDLPNKDQMAAGGSHGPTFGCGYNFVQEVEAYDIERGLWKTINYITDNNKLKMMHAGAIQVTGKKIMIFGGMVDYEV